jgi:hypothetical protein
VLTHGSIWSLNAALSTVLDVHDEVCWKTGIASAASPAGRPAVDGLLLAGSLPGQSRSCYRWRLRCSHSWVMRRVHCPWCSSLPLYIHCQLAGCGLMLRADWLDGILANWPIVPAVEDLQVWGIWQNENWQGKPKNLEETCLSTTLCRGNQRTWTKPVPSTTLSTTNPTWLDLGCCYEKLATNCLKYGMDCHTKLHSCRNTNCYLYSVMIISEYWHSYGSLK